jgi:pyrimidine-nucleoside phosphorylase
MVDIGNSFGVKTIAVITDMNEPLGMAVGNSLEVSESIDALKGKGPEDLMEVTLYLGALMLKIAGIEKNLEAGKEKLKQLIKNGSALQKFEEMVQLQGGNTKIIERPTLLPHSCLSVDVPSKKEGYIQSIDAEAIGTISMILGAGRERMDSDIDHAAGIILRKKVGDYVKKDDTLCTFCTSNESITKKAEEIFLNALTFGEKPPEKKKMIIDVIE